MKELYDILPNIIVYITLGFIFTHCYRFTKVSKEKDDFNTSFFEIIVSGYILSNIYYLIPISINSYVDIICMTITTALVGYSLAKFMNSQESFKLLNKIRISHTTKETIWQEIRDNNLAVYVKCYDYEHKIFYFGRIIKYECFERQPLIILSNYSEELGNKTVVDYTAEKYPIHTVLIDTSKFQDVHLIYQSSSKKPEEWMANIKQNAVNNTTKTLDK